MEACLCRRGVDRMRDDAARSTQRLSLHSPLRGPATVLEGLAALLQGDAAAADPLLAAGAELCLRSGNFPGGRGVWPSVPSSPSTGATGPRAQALSDEAVTIVREGHVEAYVQATVVYAVAARAAAQAGDVQQAQSHVVASARLRPRCTAAIPWSAQFLVQLAHAYLALGDPRGARAVLRQVRRHHASSPRISAWCQSSAPSSTGCSTRDQRRVRRCIVPHRRRAAAPAAAGHPPDLPGDRRAAAPLPEHHQVRGGVGAPQAGRLVARSRPWRWRSRSACSVGRHDVEPPRRRSGRSPSVTRERAGRPRSSRWHDDARRMDATTGIGAAAAARRDT